MKKERVLKYLILICTMTLAFFIFANREISAANYEVNDGKVNLTLEQVDVDNPSAGYIIVGATTTCTAGDIDCLKDWSIPETYVDSHPIVAIQNSSDELTGVLDALAQHVSGTVSIGDSMQIIGNYAFANFSNVKEYVLGTNVSLIGDYAFSSNTSLEAITIKAYNGGIKTKLSLNENDEVTAFKASPNLSKIVFKNATIAGAYIGGVQGWDQVDALFTYKVTYRFYAEDNSLFATQEGFVDERLGEVPEDIEKIGFDFKWVAKNDVSNVITADSIATDGEIDAVLGQVFDVVPSWTIKKAQTHIETTFNSNKIEHTDRVNNVEITYIGRDTKMLVDLVLNHELLTDSNFKVYYSWTKTIQGIELGEFSVSNDFSIFRVSDSGNYNCLITLTYPGYESITQEVEINVVINPKELEVTIKDLEKEYGEFVTEIEDTKGNYYIVDSADLTDGEVIKSFILNKYEVENEVGNYADVLTGAIKIIGYENDITSNYINEYKITYKNGDLKVTPKIIDYDLQENIEIVYGASEELSKKQVTTIYGQEKQISINFIRTDISNKNVGTYDIVGAYVSNDGETDANFAVNVLDVSTGKVVIKAKEVSVDWNVEENLVYSGIEKSISASYRDITNKVVDLRIGVVKNRVDSTLVNAGTYNVTAEMITKNDNYKLIGFEKEVVIEKADSVFIGAQRQTAVYSGLPQRVNVTLNHSEGVVQYGDYSNCKNAHLTSSATCTISVFVTETENYKSLSGNFYLHINPYELEVEPKLFEFDYGTTIGQNNLYSTYKGVNNEDVTVYFAKEGSATGVEVGYYNLVSAYLTSNTNYKPLMVENSGINKVKVNPAPVYVKFYFYEGLVYDGNIKNIGIRYFDKNNTAMSTDVGLVVDYGEDTVIRNAGDYRINVSVTNPNYRIDGKSYLDFSIAKANYDISGLRLTSKKVTFNFENHFINLEGDLPEGLSAVYTIDGKSGNGTALPFKHTVKVSFIGDFENYNYITPLVATLNVDMTWVWLVLLLVLSVGIGAPIIFILLVRKNIIRFRKRIKNGEVRRLLKISRQLDEITAMFIENKISAGKVDNDVEEGILVENDVTFIKNPNRVRVDNKVEMAFVDELFKSTYGTKQLYSEVKNELLSYEGVVSKIKRDYETFYLNDMPIVKLDVIDGILYAFFALDPTQYKVEEYGHKDVSKDKEYRSVPLKLTINSVQSLRHAKMFIRIIRRREGAKAVSNFVRTDYISVYTAKEESFKVFKKVFAKKGTRDYSDD